MSFLPLVRIWLLVSALASAAGWILSALGWLNPAGYAVSLVLSLRLFYLARRELLLGDRLYGWSRIKSRLARPFPLIFTALAALVFLGGALYPPSNYDALTYRLPRVLHWLAEGQWHWIHAGNSRMNDRSCGFEWLMAPILAATGSDRGLFLINFLPFLLLPGLVFSVFTRLGVQARVAWHWMWLLPTGYNFLLQAASLGNDAYAAVYALAAVDFALRARASRRVMDVWMSLLAAALLTGAKPGNLPLLLPWIMVFLPRVPDLFSRTLASVAVFFLALLASFLPTAILNHLHCGDWTGMVLENTSIGIRNPVVGILGNTTVFLTSNFVPTLFPLAGWWNHSILTFLPDQVNALLAANFEAYFYRLGEIPTEEAAGLGFGLSMLLAVSLLYAGLHRSRRPSPVLTWPRGMLLLSPYVALLVFFAKSGMMTLARIVSAYYPLLLPALLCASAQPALVRQVWWRRAALASMLLASVAVVLTPARPLWPVRTAFHFIGDAGASRAFVSRIRDVYLTYADRPDPLARVRAALPEDCSVVGFAGAADDTEISLWRPFGKRRVEHVLFTDSLAQIRARRIKFAMVGETVLGEQHQTIQAWLQQHQATLITSISATMTVSLGPRRWYVVRLE
ncbi:MAG: hypothetical protein WCH99_01395 [Verrucomicrobiota bacterium]